MILSFQDNNQESDYPPSEDDQYEEALYQFIELCSKHKLSKGTAASFLRRLFQEISEMSMSDYDNELADSGYQKKPLATFILLTIQIQRTSTLTNTLSVPYAP